MSENDPIHLLEDQGTGDRFLVYASEKGPRLDIRFEGETLWMTQEQIARLFGKDRTAVTRHIGNIFAERELGEANSVRKMHTTQGRPALLYNLDVVISVGYRVSSVQATQFRKWATGVLVQYARKGFVVDAQRLKSGGPVDSIAELREIIRDIRSDETNVYRELKRICALCRDYDAKSSIAASFFRNTQAKLVYAVTSQTPSELVFERADHGTENMGLTNFPGDSIRKQDVTVSKNYLAPSELKELNRLTTILLDIFEDQADFGRLIVMDDAADLLDRQLSALGRSILRHGGRVSAEQAKIRAETEYGTFDAQRRAERHAAADATIRDLSAEAKRLPKGGDR